MSVGNAARQIYWLTAISNEEFTPQFAIMVSIYNSFWNSANDLLFTSAAFSASLSSGQAFPQWPLVVGVLSYLIGQGLETVSEIQRKNFKSDPANKGKAYTGGLWKYARHVNYTGYSLWRAGYACAGGGFLWGSFMLAWSVADFTRRSIPALDKYCSERVS
jgi:steroid 5-alpha reductase family enzyme